MITIKLTLESIQIMMYVINPSSVKKFVNTDISRRTQFVLLIVQTLIDLFLFVYFVYLLALHVYLKNSGQTTYDYIKRQ